MKRKNVENMREIRLWVGQIIIPTVVTVSTVLAIPEVREALKAKAKQVKKKY